MYRVPRPRRARAASARPRHVSAHATAPRARLLSRLVARANVAAPTRPDLRPLRSTQDRHFIGGRYIEVTAFTPPTSPLPSSHAPPARASGRAGSPQAARGASGDVAASSGPGRSQGSGAGSNARVSNGGVGAQHGGASGGPRASAAGGAHASSKACSSTCASGSPRASPAEGGREPRAGAPSGARDPPPAPGTCEEHVLKMRGLPFKASAHDVVSFFESTGVHLGESSVHLGVNSQGRPTGEASVYFRSAEVCARKSARARARRGVARRELVGGGAIVGEAISRRWVAGAGGRWSDCGRSDLAALRRARARHARAETCGWCGRHLLCARVALLHRPRTRRCPRTCRRWAAGTSSSSTLAAPAAPRSRRRGERATRA